MSDRDYAVEMREVIDKFTPEGPYTARGVAEEVVLWLRAHDADLLLGWLDKSATRLIAEMISTRDRSVRTHNRMTGGRSVFADKAAQAEAGNTAPLADWLNTRYTVEGNVRKTLGSLNKKDLTFVAGEYELRAKDNLFESVFLRTLAKKVGNRTVGEVFSDEQIAKLHESLPQIQF